jgi:hypothetical protein
MPTLPFLYLPDAVTLVLLLLVLGLLRSVAVSHIRQEMLVIRKEMLSFRLNSSLERDVEGYLALLGLIDASIRLAPRLSPARLLFTYRLERREAQKGRPLPLADPARAVGLIIDRTKNKIGREKLKRLQMEINLGMGTFLLMGSISGWGVFLVVVIKMIRRSVTHHPAHRIDAFFDMTERVLSRFGRLAQRIGFAGHDWAAPGCAASEKASARLSGGN